MHLATTIDISNPNAIPYVTEELDCTTIGG